MKFKIDTIQGLTREHFHGVLAIAASVAILVLFLGMLVLAALVCVALAGTQ